MSFPRLEKQANLQNNLDTNQQVYHLQNIYKIKMLLAY